MILDPGIHERRGHGRVIALVVTEPPVAEHVDDDVPAELLAELRGHLDGVDRRLGIVPVDVKDRRLDHQRHIRGVGRGTAVLGCRGEADLVVDDEVDAATGPVTPGAGDGEALRHHALAREGGVAVHQ